LKIKTIYSKARIIAFSKKVDKCILKEGKGRNGSNKENIGGSNNTKYMGSKKKNF
jgi:hypothetical protein